MDFLTAVTLQPQNKPGLNLVIYVLSSLFYTVQFIYYSSLATLQSKQIKHFKPLYGTSTRGCEGTITVFWSSSPQRLFRQLNKEQPEFAR